MDHVVRRLPAVSARSGSVPTMFGSCQMIVFTQCEDWKMTSHASCKYHYTPIFSSYKFLFVVTQWTYSQFNHFFVWLEM
jgi:hypothetical protein